MAIAQEVSQYSGVQLGDKQQDMVVQRLKRRMTVLGISEENEYVEYYLSNKESEFRELLSLFTTHHTFFFREFKQFEFLKTHALPKLIPEVRKRENKTIYLWVAACSRGQESYSLSIFLEQCLKEMAPDLKFEIHGSDIDAISVDFARNAVFIRKEIDSIPAVFQAGNFQRGLGEYSDYVKIHPRHRERCLFQPANLVDTKTWPQKKFDMIFCRNVFIYFSPQDIENVSNNFRKTMYSHGFLFLGLTETLNGLNVPMKSVGPSVYANEPLKKKEAPAGAIAKPIAKAPTSGVVIPMPAAASSAPPVRAKEEQKVYRVLCVDDSPTILTLLKQIFSKEDGFSVVETALNGEDAIEKVKNGKFDLITLDIHMPKMTGLDFLKNTKGMKLPPVIVISSVERQDQGLAMEMLKLGAKDYVQKPSLKDFKDRRDEILFKSKMLMETASVKFEQTVDSQFADQKKEVSGKGTVGVIFAKQDLAKAQQLEKSATADQKYKLLPVENKFFGGCDIYVVLSKMNVDELSFLTRTGAEVYLLEEAYKQESKSLSEKFDLHPMTSLAYVINLYLKEKNNAQ